ncbi:DUF6963 family protein [Bordetella genomosp. 12]|uniref:Uncharacterized protein n=1 Tax=Bordetella genomosp. 12 TaxID=463035 RepID=A0A261VCD9_9BORD|nr:hypothetical protein [Bordetella genomosp. 12]OZI70823.1 hypothetical protein CAL22_13030 [Bordetella genomosp. 12]
MTIGVAASGERAAWAVRDAVLGAELLGRGAIGGFAVLAILDEQGRVDYRSTQRGGVTALDLPASWQCARVAAAISSGPDRPEPLTQFLAGESALGLVTGHRLPNQAGGDGTALNQAVLQRMKAGMGPQQAVDEVLAAHGEWDAGLIALDTRGRLGMGNSVRVTRRDDVGELRRQTHQGSLGLLHNSIYTRAPLAPDLAELAWARLTGRAGGLQLLTLAAPVHLELGKTDRVHIDAQGRIQGLETADPRLAGLQRAATAVYLGAGIWRDGRWVGRAQTELYAELRGGTVHPAAAGSYLLMRGRDVAP